MSGATSNRAAGTRPVCKRCRGEGLILGVPLHNQKLPRGWMPSEEGWYECDDCDGKGYIEGGTP